MMKTRIFAQLDFVENPEYGLPRDEWLAKRRLGIGSSDVAPICGLDRFRSPMAVYLDKIGERADDEETPIMRFGRKLEQVVADEFEVEHPELWTERPIAMYQHAEVDVALASPDRFVNMRDTYDPGVLEIKTGRNEKVWSEGPPSGYVLQTLHQMEVCGVEQGWIAVLLNGRDYRSFDIARDPILAEMLMDREREFWQRVVDRNPPPADGHEATTEALNRLYAASSPEKTVELNGYEQVLQTYKETQARLKVVKEDHAMAGNALRLALGDAEIGKIDGEIVATWKKSTGGKGRIDLKALEAEEPEIAARFREPADSRRLLVK